MNSSAPTTLDWNRRVESVLSECLSVADYVRISSERGVVRADAQLSRNLEDVLSTMIRRLVLNKLIDSVRSVEWTRDGANIQLSILRNPAQGTPNRSAIDTPILAIGGASGAGKTTVFRTLQRTFPGLFVRQVAFTNRPKRVGEAEGDEYNFTHLASSDILKHFPHAEPVYAREFAYWVDTEVFFASLLSRPMNIHVVFHSYAHEIRRFRRLFPSYLSVYLYVPQSVLVGRLTRRGDPDLSATMDYNATLDGTTVTNVVVDNSGDVGASVAAIVDAVIRHLGIKVL